MKDSFSTLKVVVRMDKTEVMKFLIKPNGDLSFSKKNAKITKLKNDIPLYRLKAIGPLVYKIKKIWGRALISYSIFS